MPSKIDISEDSKVSLPAKNLLFILAAVAIGSFSYFNLQERLTLVETELQLISKDLEKAVSSEGMETMVPNKKEDPKDMKRKQTMTNQKATKVEMEPKVEYDK